MLDWDRDLDGLARAVRREQAAPAAATAVKARRRTACRCRVWTWPGWSPPGGAARPTRASGARPGPSVVMPGRLLPRPRDDPLRSGRAAEDVRWAARACCSRAGCCRPRASCSRSCSTPSGQTPIFVICNGVPLSKATMLDGLVLAAALNAARTPSAYPIVLERIGDLTGDRGGRRRAHAQELQALRHQGRRRGQSNDLRDHLVPRHGPAGRGGGIGDLSCCRAGPTASRAG